MKREGKIFINILLILSVICFTIISCSKPQLPNEKSNKTIEAAGEDSRLVGKSDIKLWRGDNHTVPYCFRNTFTATELDAISRAMEILTNTININFKKEKNCFRDNFIGYSERVKERLNISKYKGYAEATVGKVTYPELKLTNNVPYGDVLHELIHVLGFNHEQQRYDRNEYVTITSSDDVNYGRITENFKIYNSNYDFDSIMHYRENNQLSLNPDYKKYEDRIGQNIGLSFHDTSSLITVYGAAPNKPRMFVYNPEEVLYNIVENNYINDHVLLNSKIGIKEDKYEPDSMTGNNLLKKRFRIRNMGSTDLVIKNISFTGANKNPKYFQLYTLTANNQLSNIIISPQHEESFYLKFETQSSDFVNKDIIAESIYVQFDTNESFREDGSALKNKYIFKVNGVSRKAKLNEEELFAPSFQQYYYFNPCETRENVFMPVKGRADEYYYKYAGSSIAGFGVGNGFWVYNSNNGTNTRAEVNIYPFNKNQVPNLEKGTVSFVTRANGKWRGKGDDTYTSANVYFYLKKDTYIRIYGPAKGDYAYIYFYYHNELKQSITIKKANSAHVVLQWNFKDYGVFNPASSTPRIRLFISGEGVGSPYNSFVKVSIPSTNVAYDRTDILNNAFFAMRFNLLVKTDNGGDYRTDGIGAFAVIDDIRIFDGFDNQRYPYIP